MPLLAAFLLTACGGSIPSIKPPRLDAPETRLTEDCASPVALPAHELPQLEVERLWSRDRANLVACKDRHSGVVRFYLVRDTALGGKKLK